MFDKTAKTLTPQVAILSKIAEDQYPDYTIYMPNLVLLTYAHNFSYTLHFIVGWVNQDICLCKGIDPSVDLNIFVDFHQVSIDQSKNLTPHHLGSTSSSGFILFLTQYSLPHSCISMTSKESNILLHRSLGCFILEASNFSMPSYDMES